MGLHYAAALCHHQILSPFVSIIVKQIWNCFWKGTTIFELFL